MTGDEVLLAYTMPLPPEGISEEKVGVLYSVHSSGAEGTRTPDLLRAKEALSLLSYSPMYQEDTSNIITTKGIILQFAWHYRVVITITLKRG